MGDGSTGSDDDRSNMKLIRVTCPKEVLLAREAMRGNRCPGSAEASDTFLFPKDGYDLMVDTYVMSAAECAERIFESAFYEDNRNAGSQLF